MEDDGWVVTGRIVCLDVGDPADFGLYGLDGFLQASRETVSTTACSVAGAIDSRQKNAKGTLQIGIAATGTLNPVAATGGGGVAMDGKGNIGVYSYLGPLAGVGGGGDANISVQGSNANSISDLGGWFLNTSAHAGAGEGGSVDMFVAPDGSVKGGGATAGPSLSASVNAGATYTSVVPLLNPLNGLKFTLESLGQCPQN